MDCYKILKVNSDASDEEIYKSYISLKSNYSASYNTSPYARRKYREIEKAYEIIKNELKREIYSSPKEDIKEELEEIELFDYESFYKNDNKDDVYVPVSLKNISLFKDIDAINIEKEKVIKEIDVDYSYYVLSRRFDFNYLERVECNHSINKVEECRCCNSIGKVQYKDEVVYCPLCNGKGVTTIHICDYCNDFGYVKREVKESIFIDDDILENGLYRDGILYRFNLINKDSIDVDKNHIYIHYDLSIEESISGIDFKWDTLNGVISIKDNIENIKKEYVFDLKKKVHILINKVAYKGNDVHKYLFVKVTDLHKKLYLDPIKCLYNESMLSSYNKEIIIEDEKNIVISGYGKDGLNGGEKGDLILTPIIANNVVNVDNIDEYQIEKIDTNVFTNIFGGRVYKRLFLGFKGKNATFIDSKNKKIFILSGNSKEKKLVSSYFWLTVVVYLLWVIMPLLLVILPYTKEDLIISCVFTIVYSIVANILLNLKL